MRGSTSRNKVRNVDLESRVVVKTRMSQFSVTALNENGKEVTCTVEGATPEEALASVRVSGLIPTGIMARSSVPWTNSAPEAARVKASSNNAPAAANQTPPLDPYSTPFIAALHGFAGGLAGLAFVFALIVLLFDGASEQRFLLCVSAGLVALINFGLAQIIDIIARAAYATRQQVELLRQLIHASGQQPRV